MRNLSSEFKEQLKNDNRDYLVKATITLINGEILELGNEDIWEEGLKIEDSVSEGQSFQIGSAIINKLTLTLSNLYGKFSSYDFFGAKLILKITLPSEKFILSYNNEILTYDGKILGNEKKYDVIHMGTYTVDDPQYNGSLITLECLDNMSKFDEPYSKSTLKYPATVFNIVYDCCSVCDVQLDTTAFSNMNVVVQERPTDDAITFREVLQWASQIACSWAKCDEYGRLKIEWCRQDLLESENPDPKLYNTVTEISSISTSTDDVVVTGLRVTYVSTEEESEVTKEILKGETGYVLSLEGNRLIQPENAEEVAEFVSGKVIGLRFRPFTLSHLDDPAIESGDIIKIIDFDDVYWSIVTSTTFFTEDYQSTSCGAETPSRNRSTQYSEATKTYVELRKLVKKEQTDREVAIANLNKVLAESSGLYQTVDVQEDGSSIYYLHDKPKLEDSMTVIKLTAGAIGVSTDGGKTYPYGFTVTGEMIIRILQTEGINADWIRTGNLLAKDKDGKTTFSVDIDTGEVIIDASKISIGSKSIEETINEKVDGLQIGSVNLLHNSKNMMYEGNFFAAYILHHNNEILIHDHNKLTY